jgi:hypothetical protein
MNHESLSDQTKHFLVVQEMELDGEIWNLTGRSVTHSL